MSAEQTLGTPQTVGEEILHGYYKFPIESRSLVLRGLMIAANEAPDIGSIMVWELMNGDPENLFVTPEETLRAIEFDPMYARIANGVAKCLDENYDPKHPDALPEIKALRDKFLALIRVYTQEDLNEGAHTVLERDRTSVRETTAEA